jgi:hypothetical protein
MSGYTSGNKAPTLMAQAPNRKGNIGRMMASHTTGVTAVTRPQGSLNQPSGNQGAPKFARATDNTASGATAGRGQKVTTSRPKELYDGMCHNDGYMNSDRTNYLK